MATPHDDDAPPPAHEPNCLPPEPCVCAGLRATADTVTAADLDLVDRLPVCGIEVVGEELSDSEIADVKRAIALFPRLAWALRAAIGDPESYAYQQGHARGRREAIEEAAEIADRCSGGDHETPARAVIAARIRAMGARS